MVSRDQWPQPNDASEARVIENVRRFGCHIVTVECEIGRGIPDFGYSVGFFAQHSQPEVLVLGVSSQTAGRILNEVNQRIEAGFVIDPGGSADALYEGKAFQFRPIEPHIAVDYLGFAFWFYRHIPRCEFPIVQAIWPDRTGRFPGDPNCHPKVVEIQRVKAIEEGGRTRRYRQPR